MQNKARKRGLTSVIDVTTRSERWRLHTCPLSFTPKNFSRQMGKVTDKSVQNPNNLT